MAEQREVIPRERHKWPPRAELERMRDTMDSKQISDKLGIPQKTVCNHFARIGIKFRQRPMVLTSSRHKQKRLSIRQDESPADIQESSDPEKARQQTVEEFLSAGGSIEMLPSKQCYDIRPACSGILD